MNRIIKFRAWDRDLKVMYYQQSDFPIVINIEGDTYRIEYQKDSHKLLQGISGIELMQFTGLKDKNDTCKDIYEGDIIDSNGKVRGNIYEDDKGETDLVIEGFGTKTWCATYQKAVERGCKDAE